MRGLPEDNVLVGASAARLHGLDIVRGYDEVAVLPTSGVRSKRGLVVRHVVFPPGDVLVVKGVRVTSLHREIA